MLKITTLALSALLVVPSLQAQATKPDPLLDRLIGQWVLRGPMAGKETVHDVTFRWVLDSEYVEMHEVSRDRTPAGKPGYEAIVYLVHDPHTHKYGAFWLDNTDYNAFYPAGVGHGSAAGDSIPFVFVDSPRDRMRTTFVYDRASDTWAWHMDSQTGARKRQFARVTLRRASAPDSVNLSGSWATGTMNEPALPRLTLHIQCNYTPSLWTLEQHGDSVRLWVMPESYAQGVPSPRPVSSTQGVAGRVSGVNVTIGSPGARYELRYDTASGHLRGTLNGAPFWAVRQEIVRPQGCIPPP